MPVLDVQVMEIISQNPDQTRRLGERLGGALQIGDVICLQGDLGAGKTTFVQGIALGWGSVDSVSSPTFILVNVYRRADGGHLFHMDAYRLDSMLEAEQLDLDSMITQGALIIEWPERMKEIVPAEMLWVQFNHVAEQKRGMKFHATGSRHEALLEALRGAGGG